MAYEMTMKPACASGGNTGYLRTALIDPPVAKILAAGGYTKQSFKEDIVKTARQTCYELAHQRAYGAVSGTPGTFEEELKALSASPAAEKGKLPPWYEKLPGWEEVKTMPSIDPGKFEILVCGDRDRNKTQTLSSIEVGRYATKEIKLPANWDALMEKLGYPPLKSCYL